MNEFGVAIMAVGVVILLIGYAICRSGVYPTCSECKAPMPDGYEAYEDGKTYCRSCCRKLRVRPWYWKDWMQYDN